MSPDEASLRSEERRLGEAWAAHRDDLRRYLRRLVDDEALADDLAQEAGMRLLRAGRDGSIREPRAWLFHAGANLARDALRKRTTWAAAAAEIAHADEGLAPAPDELAAMDQDLGALRRAIEDLPPQARRILLLARVEGRSHKEIARLLGLATKTVENHLGRAVARLAQALGRRPGGNA
jgi:RNA polymerase sigma-70 factor (ECF subfamily)